jgi:dihydrofolate reductase
MRKLTSFTQITLDGYFANEDGTLDWAHKDPSDTEFNGFVEDNAKGGGALVFGRITYEIMKGFWPTPAAQQLSPVVAERMNNLPKIVFSRTLAAADWQNTTLVRDDVVTAMRALKQQPGPDLAILGSGSLVAQLTEARLVDTVQIVLNPLVLGRGQRLFERAESRFALDLKRTRTFRNGCVLLDYEPRA